MKKFLLYIGFFLFLRPSFLQGKVIHIPENYETIQEGIDEAAKGDTVLISPGTYYENVRMKDGITLEGVDVNTTVITDDGVGPPDAVVDLSCDCTLQNLTITGARGAGVGHAVVVLKGSPKVLNNIIRDNNYTGLGIHSEVVKIKAFVSGNRIYGNGGAGISNLGAGTDNMIVQNNVYKNNNLGIVVLDNGSATIKNNEIWENGVGIVVKTGGKAVVEGNILKENKTVGIVVKEKAFLDLKRSRVLKNGTPGISIDNSTANMFDNSVMYNGTIGIFYKNDSKGVLDSNEIASVLPNLVLVQNSEVTIINNKIYGSEGMKNALSFKESKITLGENELTGGIKSDEATTIKTDESEGKVTGSGCLGLF